MNNFRCEKELRRFNAVMRFSYKRFKEGLTEKEVRATAKKVFLEAGSWFLQCAMLEGKAAFHKADSKNIVFGGKKNWRDYMKGLKTKEEYRKKRLAPVTVQGQKLAKGNRLFDFHFDQNCLILKLSKTDHRRIQLPAFRPVLKQELLRLQDLTERKQATVTVRFNEEFVYLIYDEALVSTQKYKGLKSSRVLGLDLNPNYIGLSVLEFNAEDKFKVLFKKVFDLTELNKLSGRQSSDRKSKYLVNKRKFELLQVCHQISSLVDYWKCAKVCIEDLDIKADDKGHGRTFNRLCNNVWNRSLVIDKLKMLAAVHSFQLVQVNPAYSSFVGNMLYGGNSTPDMVAAAIEIARRGYKKFSKGWFYPIFNIESLDERWKQTLTGVKDWIGAFKKIKESGLKYRFQLGDLVSNAVFRKNHIQKRRKDYVFL